MLDFAEIENVRKKTIIPKKGKKISFHGESTVFVSEGRIIPKCEVDCSMDHECYKEDYLCIKEETWTAKPLSRLGSVFNKEGWGCCPIHTDTKLKFEKCKECEKKG